MADPKPTIRVESCRGDGRCPECGDPGWVVNSPTQGVVAVLAPPCGCATCINWACTAKHTRALLTEALRQLSECMGDALALLNRATAAEERDEAPKSWRWDWTAQRARAEKAERERDAAIRERDLARAHDAQPYPTAEAYERVCAALEATKRSLEQTRAAMEAGDLCTVCAGTGKPVSGKPCICGGHGGIGNQIIGLTREAFAGRERSEKAEALLRKCEVALTKVHLTYAPAPGERVIGLSPLLSEIREVLPK